MLPFLRKKMTDLGILLCSPAELGYRANTLSTKTVNGVFTPQSLQKLVNHKLGIINVDMFKDISYFSVLARLDFYCTFAASLEELLITVRLYWECQQWSPQHTFNLELVCCENIVDMYMKVFMVKNPQKWFNRFISSKTSIRRHINSYF